LEEDYKEQLENREKNTRKKVLNHFAKDVVQHLKYRRVKISDGLTKYQSILKRLVQAELADVEFKQDCFELENKEFCLSWKNAEKKQSHIFSVKESLGKEIIDKVKHRSLMDRVSLQFHHNAQELPKEVYLDKFIGMRGYLQLNLLEIKSEKRRIEYLLANAYSDGNKSLPDDFGEKLLLIPAQKVELNTSFHPDLTKLNQLQSEGVKKHLAQVDEDNEKWFDQEENKLENWKEDQINDLKTSLDDLETEIALNKKELRKLSRLKEKIDFRKKIKSLEGKRDNKMIEFYEKKKEMSDKTEALLDYAEKSLELTHEIKTIFTIRWELLS
jgi:hypothetical protein